MNRCIVYFSKDGNTEYVAKLLASEIEGELIKLAEKSPRDGVIGFIKSGFQAVTKASSKLIGEPWNKIEDFDFIYVMTPIWAGNGTPAINAFLDKVDLKNKSIGIITLQSDASHKGIEKTHEYLMNRVKSKGGIATECFALTGSSPGKFAGEERLKNEFKRVIMSGSA
ncbi:MAG: putative flavodoxin [Clostridiales bacterium 38_11]|nr:MAG: putative flavodoxin [Clostridiales bacterium 38_11]